MKLLFILYSVINLMLLIMPLLSIKLTEKIKIERCSDYLPKVTYPDMSKAASSIGEAYEQKFTTPILHQSTPYVTVSQNYS